MRHADGRRRHAYQIAGASVFGELLHERAVRDEGAPRESAVVPGRRSALVRDEYRGHIGSESLREATSHQLEPFLALELAGLRPGGRHGDIRCRPIHLPMGGGIAPGSTLL